MNAKVRLINQVNLSDYDSPTTAMGSGLTGLEISLQETEHGQAIILEERPADWSKENSSLHGLRTLVGIRLARTMSLTGPYGLESCNKFLLLKSMPHSLNLRGVFFPSEGVVFTPKESRQGQFWLTGFGRQALREITSTAQTKYEHVEVSNFDQAAPSLTFGWQFDAVELHVD